jgi:hypothetical protein
MCHGQCWSSIKMAMFYPSPYENPNRSRPTFAEMIGTIYREHALSRSKLIEINQGVAAMLMWVRFSRFTVALFSKWFNSQVRAHPTLRNRPSYIMHNTMRFERMMCPLRVSSTCFHRSAVSLKTWNFWRWDYEFPASTFCYILNEDQMVHNASKVNMFVSASQTWVKKDDWGSNSLGLELSHNGKAQPNHIITALDNL